MPEIAALASRFPRISNAFMRSRWVRSFMERRYGVDSRVPPPHFATQTFRAWFNRHSRTRGEVIAARGRVGYFVDTWTNYFAPSIGIAAVRLLESAGD